MSGTGVASRPPGSMALPSDLPVRIYMRALRQYQKIIDLKRFTKEKSEEGTSKSNFKHLISRSQLDLESHINLSIGRIIGLY
ncbi:unnamed protein product [Pieris brassicae]|uniref:Uncharacterized protein n=1 Tax=Pieris brassicae TaxID=7116 RepID=A0A9P0TX85_PIEBR|nr:unnamed protein product [Pieris brassicae]